MSFEADSNAAAVAAGLHAAAAQLADLEPVNREAGAMVAAAPGPRRTGATLAGVRAVTTARGVTIAGTTRNWTFTHWGAPGRNVKAQPWLLEYLEGHTDQLTQLYTDHATDAVARVNG